MKPERAAKIRRLFYLLILNKNSMNNDFNNAAHHYALESTFDNFEPDNSFDTTDPDNLFGSKKIKKELKKQRGEIQIMQDEAQKNIYKQAEIKAVSPDTIAQNNVAANQPLIASYVANNGIQPQANPAALALQATQVFQDKVEQKQVSGVPEYESAVSSVIDDEREGWEDDEQADNFFGTVMESVFKTGKALVTKINVNRKQAGKPPIFQGKNWQSLAEKIAKNEPVVTDALNASEKAFLALTKKEIDEAKKQSALSYATGAFGDQQGAAALKQYLPFIIIILIGVFFLGKKL